MDFDTLIIGAGVIGLAIGRQISASGRSVLVVEREDRFGMGASSRNTGCIHAGAYYHAGSLKAGLCRRGRELLYEHCAKHNIAHRKTGKIFLATEDRFTPGLEKIRHLAAANGIVGLTELDRSAITRLEPQLTGKAALLCPESGVVDSHELMLSLLGLAENDGLTLATRARVVAGDEANAGWKITIAGAEAATVTARNVINAAGIWAPELSRAVFPGRDVPRSNPVKGSYLRLPGHAPLSHIVYPDLVPGEITERVDATPGIDGQLRFGPSVDETKSCDDYQPSENLKDRLVPIIRGFMPNCDTDRLVSDFAGVRPKLLLASGGVADFIFDWADSDAPWLDLWGMESPGLTACLAIAEYVDRLLRERMS